MTQENPDTERLPEVVGASEPLKAVPHDPPRPGFIRYTLALLVTLAITAAGAYVSWIVLLKPAWETRVGVD